MLHIVLDRFAKHTIENKIHKIELLHGEHDAVDLTAHLHQHAGRDLLRAADPLDCLVIFHDADLRQLDAHLLPDQSGERCGCVAGADAANLPKRVQLQGVQFVIILDPHCSLSSPSSSQIIDGGLDLI